MPWTTPTRNGLGGLGSRLGRQFDRAAGLLDRGLRRRRGAGDLHIDFGGELALAEQAHAVACVLEHAGSLHRRRIDRLGSVELLVVDRLLQRAEVHHLVFLLVRRTEAALGDTAVERHLAALEALDGDAGAGFLALDAATGGLALARADAAAHAHAGLAGAGVVGDFVQSHFADSSSTRTRWCTLLIMPRTDGVSSRTRLRWRLLRPRPFRVAS